MMFWNAIVALLTVSLAVGGCGERDELADEPAEAPSAMPGMEGMQGMGMGEGGGMMGRMRTHMAMMEGVSGDSARAMLPMHRQMVANMIAQMNREMRDMGMGTNTAWDATIDSLRADLTRMPEMAAAELDQLMPEHRARVMRLLEMHEAMMRPRRD